MHSARAVGALLILVGVLLMSSGLTGRVISQSCCFPPLCPADQLCDAAEPRLEQPVPIAYDQGFGALLAAFGVLVLALDARSGRK